MAVAPNAYVMRYGNSLATGLGNQFITVSSGTGSSASWQSSTAAASGGVLRHTCGAAAGRYTLSRLIVPHCWNVEVLWKWAPSSTATSFYTAFSLRSSGFTSTSGTPSGIGRFSHNIRYNPNTGIAEYVVYQNGSNNAHATTFSFTAATGTNMNYTRFQIINHTACARMWQAANPEPSAWNAVWNNYSPTGYDYLPNATSGTEDGINMSVAMGTYNNAATARNFDVEEIIVWDLGRGYPVADPVR